MTPEKILDEILCSHNIIASCGDDLGNYDPDDVICVKHIKDKDKECLLCKEIRRYMRNE